MTDLSDTTLKDSIAAFTAAMGKQAPPEVIATLGSEIKRLADSGIMKGVLQVGSRAPGFSLPNAKGGTLSLTSLLARGPVVVTFYRGGWCPFCNLQLRTYQSALGQIHDLGAELVAISPQTADYALSDVEKKELSFPVLSDAHNEVARTYGLVFRLGEAWQKLQAGFGNPMPRFNGDDSWELPMPGTFVLDRTGVVQLAFVDPDYMKRLEPVAILDALKKLRS